MADGWQIDGSLLMADRRIMSGRQFLSTGETKARPGCTRSQATYVVPRSDAPRKGTCMNFKFASCFMLSESDAWDASDV